MATNKPGSTDPATDAAPALKGTQIGIVESDKRSKTRRVVVNYQSMHPKYGKYLKQRTILQVHDEKNESITGDVVEVGPCRPMSKTKTWSLVRVLERRNAKAAALADAASRNESKD